MTDVHENDAATDLTAFARALEELATRRAVGKQLEAWAVWLERAGTGSVNDRIAQQLRALLQGGVFLEGCLFPEAKPAEHEREGSASAVLAERSLTPSHDPAREPRPPDHSDSHAAVALAKRIGELESLAHEAVRGWRDRTAVRIGQVFAAVTWGSSPRPALTPAGYPRGPTLVEVLCHVPPGNCVSFEIQPPSGDHQTPAFLSASVGQHAPGWQPGVAFDPKNPHHGWPDVQDPDVRFRDRVLFRIAADDVDSPVTLERRLATNLLLRWPTVYEPLHRWQAGRERVCLRCGHPASTVRNWCDRMIPGTSLLCCDGDCVYPGDPNAAGVERTDWPSSEPH